MGAQPSRSAATTSQRSAPRGRAACQLLLPIDTTPGRRARAALATIFASSGTFSFERSLSFPFFLCFSFHRRLRLALVLLRCRLRRRRLPRFLLRLLLLFRSRSRARGGPFPHEVLRA